MTKCTCLLYMYHAYKIASCRVFDGSFHAFTDVCTLYQSYRVFWGKFSQLVHLMGNNNYYEHVQVTVNTNFAPTLPCDAKTSTLSLKKMHHGYECCVSFGKECIQLNFVVYSISPMLLVNMSIQRHSTLTLGHWGSQ